VICIGDGLEHDLHILLAAYHADISPQEESKIKLCVEEVKWVYSGELPEPTEFAPADIVFFAVRF